MRCWYPQLLIIVAAMLLSNQFKIGSSYQVGNPFFDDEYDDGKYILLLVSRLGLANRLRTMADWHQIAVSSNRTLLVSWESTIDCNASFTDLFVSGETHDDVVHPLYQLLLKLYSYY